MTAQTRLAAVGRAVAAAPVVSPTSSVLKDDKTIMVLATVVSAALVTVIPELKPYANVLVLFIGFAGLILTGHQAIEDYLKALAEYKATVNSAPTQQKLPDGQVG